MAQTQYRNSRPEEQRLTSAYFVAQNILHMKLSELTDNRTMWDDWAVKHVDSEFYDTPSFIEGRNSLPALDKIWAEQYLRGKRVMHAQCHFGQDSISLQRLGARVTGVDFSENAIKQAKRLATQCDSDAQFVCSNILEVSSHFSSEFDAVYSSYGTIGWLPDLTVWANEISAVLKPGGMLVLIEFHPFLWMYDNAQESILYSYFNKERITENASGSYAAPKSDSVFVHHTWNHPLSEVIQALISAGFRIEEFTEKASSPYPCFENVSPLENGEYTLEQWGEKVPMVYGIRAVREV